MALLGELDDSSPTLDLGSRTEGSSADINLPRNIAPISKLDEDVLWKIFLINTDMTDDNGRIYESDRLSSWNERALIVTWRSALVCRRWREVMIHSSLLWGRVIDLDGLARTDPAMNEQVLRRTNHGPLTVNGSVFAEKPKELGLFVSILQGYWPRIQRLAVRISNANHIPNHTWDILYKPAPALQSFRIRVPHNFTISSPSTARTLFANEAPLLYHFRSWRFDASFTPEMRWISQIRHLDVTHATSMSVQDWLRVLEQMPRLEALNLELAVLTPPDTRTSAQIPLPNLQAVKLDNHLRACTVLLDQIIPGIGCNFSLTTPEGSGEPFSAQDVTLANRVVSRYSKNWFNSRTVTNLVLVLLYASFSVTDNRENYDKSGFNISVYCSVPEHVPIVLPAILDAISVSNLSNITYFYLLAGSDTFPELDSTIYDFLALLPTVETLSTRSDGVSVLHRLSAVILPIESQGGASRQLLFPRLRTIEVDVRGGVPDYDEITQLFSAFLAFRKEYESPVETLDLTKCGGFPLATISSLDGITGLKVIYLDGEERREYICGTIDEDTTH